MKSLVMINADAGTDTIRERLLEALAKPWPNLRVGFFGAGHDLTIFTEALNPQERGPVQFWIHLSAFRDERELGAWLETIDSSWLSQARFLFYSGGGLQDWHADELSERIIARGAACEILAQPFPASEHAPGYQALRDLLTCLSTGLDPRIRRKAACNLLDTLMLRPDPAEQDLSFQALCQLFGEARRERLHACWRAYCEQPGKASLSALRDLLLGD